MIIALHIISALLGVVGGYIYSLSFFRAIAHRAEPRGAVYAVGRVAALVGLLGVAVSGFVLFLQNTELFFTSHIFLSHMTAMALIAFFEACFFGATNLKVKTGLRVASLYSWSFVLAVALLRPEVPYLALMAAYVCAGTLVMGVYGARFAPGVGESAAQRA